MSPQLIAYYVHDMGRSYFCETEVFTAPKIKVVFWVVMPCSDVVGYQPFRRLHCLQLQGEMKMVLLPHYYIVTTQKTMALKVTLLSLSWSEDNLTA
jgi:hypothetical protein